MDEYVIGLDWINKRKGWAYCRLFPTRQNPAIELGLLETACQDDTRLRAAARVVVDAPVGLLPSGKNTDGEDRPCDKGAKRWIGPGLPNSVITPPYQAELDRWRKSPETRNDKGGHIQGLLPAIDAAARVAEVNPNTLESHPELVFAFLLRKTLPAEAAKATLLGAMVRLGVLAANGLRVSLRELVVGGRVATDNFLDAIALAVVARDWQHRGEVQVIRAASGNLEPLGPDPGRRSMLMAVPHAPDATRPLPRATRTELLAHADRWMGGAKNGPEAE